MLYSTYGREGGLGTSLTRFISTLMYVVSGTLRESRIGMQNEIVLRAEWRALLLHMVFFTMSAATDTATPSACCGIRISHW